MLPDGILTTAAQVGLGIGLLLAVLNYLLALAVIRRVELPETRAALTLAAKIDLVVLPLIGLAIGAWLS